MSAVATIPVVDEAAKRRLVEYLIGKVASALAGRDEGDLVDTMPSRAIFAGVISPPRERDRSAAIHGLASGDAPTGAAIGLDFRILPSNASGAVVRLSGRWAHYAPVFPTWQQISEPGGADPNSLVAAEQAGRLAGNAPASGGAAESEMVEATGESSDAADGSAPGGEITLPRVWRRWDVSVDGIEIPISPEMRPQFVGESTIADAVSRTREQILRNPDGWHHIGPIKERSRRLGDRSKITDAASFDSALKSKDGTAVSPPEWMPTVSVQARPDVALAGAVRIRVLLANATPEIDPDDCDPGLMETALFDAGLQVEVIDGQLVPFDFTLAARDYRIDPKIPGKGINCSLAWHSDDPNRLSTETLPEFKQPFYRARDELELRFESLTEDTYRSVLARIETAMAGYLDAWQAFLDSPESEKFTPEQRAACASDRDAFGHEVDGFRLGTAVLAHDPLLRRAFVMMNRAFLTVSKRSGGRITGWRMFQLAFICSQLPSLAVRQVDRGSSDVFSKTLLSTLDEVGVLWFPTGGGKTEAYLGLIAVALLYDRLRGKTRGLSVWMRFPLRMLSLQQLDRLARVIAALNELRASEALVANGDPFLMGYYVGDNNTPNAVSIEDMKRLETSEAERTRLKLLRKCPHCSEPVGIRLDKDAWRVRHVCTNSQCFSNTSTSLGTFIGSLPICVVDNEIYRYLPAVLVGTVDKLAIMGRNRHFAHLVRGVTQKCPEHGYASLDECLERWTGCKRTTKRSLVALPPVIDPGPMLLVQDELHLLREELGVFNGHYESLLRYLGGRSHLPPKVLAATATIEAYDVQAFHIYLCSARRFPQPGWELGESFYATSQPVRHRRFYLGVLNHTRAIEDSALRIVGVYQREIRRLAANPGKARGLLEAEGLSDSDVQAILRLYDLSVCYVNKKATGGSILDKLGRADALLQPEGLGTLTPQILTGDQSIDDIGAVLERIEQERHQTDTPRLDLVAATSLISHGIDLERINMMAICGMPSHYAEYVQSSSRAGRSHPGVVFVCFRAADPRETSQYELFQPMHEQMDRLIEAVAINRFASHAPRKTVPGLMVGLLLNRYTPELFGSAISRPLDHVPTLQGALGMTPTGTACVKAEELLATIDEVIGVDRVRPPASAPQVQNAQKQARTTGEDLLAMIGRTLETKVQDVVDPLTSFRDVDEGIEFGSVDSASLVTRLRAR